MDPHPAPLRHRPPRTRFLLLFSSLLALPALAATTDGIVSPAATDTDVLLLVTYVVVALLVSFLCSVAEAVLLSITPSYIADLDTKRPKHAALLRQLKEKDIDRSLAAILTLNTIAHTVGAIGAGAKATVVFGSAWFGAFSAVMTLLILFLSEIVPKTLGAVHWRRLTGVTASYVRFLTLALYPLIIVSEALTKLIARGQTVHVFSRDEFIAMANVGTLSGHINEREQRVIHNLLRFRSVLARDVMTPRIVMSMMDEDLSIKEAVDPAHAPNFSRIPVYKGDTDHITGFVLREDMLLAAARGEGERKLSELRREILAVPSLMSLSTLLEALLEKRHHIAIVIGEFGETRGLVTLEDVVETLLGNEILDEGDKVADMQALARQLWAKRAAALGIDVQATMRSANGDAAAAPPPASGEQGNPR